MTRSLLPSFLGSLKKRVRRSISVDAESPPDQPIFQSPVPQVIDNSPQVKHILQAVSDLARKPLDGLRVLDLACAHGSYSLELAAMGAQVLGIEGRADWVKQANQRKQDAYLTNVDFVQDDVRNLSKEKYGEFDIVLCLGILYHIDAPDVFDLVAQVSDVCRGFAIVETHVTSNDLAYRSHRWRGNEYHGASYREHAPNTTSEQKLAVPGASLDNELAFWFTQPSLCNILRHVGFTSVHDVRNPVPNLFLGPHRNMKIWGNRVTLAAMKGRPVKLRESSDSPRVSAADWPEDMDNYRLEDVFVHARPLPEALG